MFNKVLLYLKKFDWILFISVILLICFGLAEIYSIALSNDSLNLLNLKKQIIFVGIGIAMLFLFAFIDYGFLRSFGNYIYLLGIIVLVGVLIFGSEIRGTKGWFVIGNSTFQPVEFIKIILIIYLARYFSRNSPSTNALKHLFFSGSITFLLMALILMQPDFGSALILFLLWGAIIAVSGFKFRYLLTVAAILVVIFGLGWLVFFQDYQKNRILTFLNPAENSLAEGYNITQAIIAVGSGGVTGRGIGFGSQSQLKFLPEAQNDFIFAVIAEELGFLGVSLIIAFFCILYYRLLSSAKKIKNDFGIYILLGTMALIFIEMFINIGMNIGLLPVVGISLPFISYGGSGMVGKLILIGIAQNVIIKSKLKY
jgi:rod shape determining protein RodA